MLEFNKIVQNTNCIELTYNNQESKIVLNRNKK